MVSRNKTRIFPTRNGLGPTKVILTEQTIGQTVLEALTLISGEKTENLAEIFANQDVLDLNQNPIQVDTIVEKITPIWVYRKPLPEPEVPFDIKIVDETDTFIIIDKPHFLATMPRGMHITQTALIKTRNATGIDTLTPAHRLDRLTAGLLLLIKNPEHRGAYQQLFAQRKITKQYHALAPKPSPELEFPITIQNYIHKTPGILKAKILKDAIPNSKTTIKYDHDINDTTSYYHLTPHTGKTHQLRIHMNHLGLPIHGDPLYPIDLNQDSHDYTKPPLKLLAHTLQFTDPITKNHHEYTSTLNL